MQRGRSRCNRRWDGRSRGGPAAPVSSRGGCRATRAPGAARPARSRPEAGSAVTGGTSGSSGQPRRTTPDYTPPYAIVPVVDANKPRAAPAASPNDPPAPPGFWWIENGPPDPHRDPHRPGHPGVPRRVRWRGVCRGRVQPVRHGPARSRGDPQRARLRAALDRLRPDRQGRARPARLAPPRGHRVRRHPRRDARCDDRDRGPGVLDEPGLRPDRHPLGRPRHHLRPAARRLDDHPAARARPLAPRVGIRGRDVRAQAARDHPVRQAHRGLSR